MTKYKNELLKGKISWNEWVAKHPKATLDFRKENLAGIDMRYYELGNAKFTESILTEAKFTHAKLLNAVFAEASLREAVFIGAELKKANFIRADLRKAYFEKANGHSVYFREANMFRAKMQNADFSKSDFVNVDLRRANLSDTNFSGANFYLANLRSANLKNSDLKGASFMMANLTGADLSGADLTGANLQGAQLINTNLDNAILDGCNIFGISAWNISTTNTKSSNLIITRQARITSIRSGPEPIITVDNLEVAQFVYLLLDNPKLRNVIDTITSKVVLILGRFTAPRLAVLQEIRKELRAKNYLPILFDFENAESRDIAETVSTLAHLSRFVIADLTDAKSISQELSFIVPNLPSVPVQPILLESENEYGMFEHFKKYPWVLDTLKYKDITELKNITLPKAIADSETKLKK